MGQRTSLRVGHTVDGHLIDASDSSARAVSPGNTGTVFLDPPTNDAGPRRVGPSAVRSMSEFDRRQPRRFFWRQPDQVWSHVPRRQRPPHGKSLNVMTARWHPSHCSQKSTWHVGLCRHVTPQLECGDCPSDGCY
jgi:hypothetical protein